MLPAWRLFYFAYVVNKAGTEVLFLQIDLY
jgi:hypothetical protein